MSVLRKAVLRPAAVLLLPAYLSACFRYVEAAPEPWPGPRSEVKVHLASPIEVPLGEVTLREVEAIEGIVSQASGDTLSVYGKWLHPRVGSKYDALGATFQVERQNIASVDHYRFSAGRTVIALGVAGAVVAGFMYAVGLAKFGGGVGKPPDEFSVRGWLR